MLGQVEPNHPFHPDSLNFLFNSHTVPYVLYEYCQTLTYATSTTPTNPTLLFPPPSSLLPLSSLFPFPPLSLDQARDLPSLSISPSPLPKLVLSSSLGFDPYNIRVGPLPNYFNFPLSISHPLIFDPSRSSSNNPFTTFSSRFIRFRSLPSLGIPLFAATSINKNQKASKPVLQTSRAMHSKVVSKLSPSRPSFHPLSSHRQFPLVARANLFPFLL